MSQYVKFQPRVQDCQQADIEPRVSIEGTMRERIIAALRTVYDPEIPVNIYDLGLIYALDIDDDNRVSVRMTLTAPACPVADRMPAEVECAIRKLTDVKAVQVELVWEPPWSQERISDEVKLELGLL